MKDLVIATFIALIIVNLIESIDKESPVSLPVGINNIREIGSGSDKSDSVISDFNYTNTAKSQYMTTKISGGQNKLISDFPIQINN